MERIKAIALVRPVLGATVCTLALIGWNGAALASPPSVTLSGSGLHQDGPEFRDASAQPSATLSGGVASGVLSTGGHEGRGGARGGPGWHEFTGKVTCMVVHGNQITVGALGTVLIEPEYGAPEELLGTYAQLLTVESGEFALTEVKQSTFATDTFGLLGRHDEGVSSAGPPSCQNASFSHQIVPEITWDGSVGGHIYLSPSITSPGDGYVSRNGTVTLSGTGEPNRLLKVYEAGDEVGARELTANANGAWSLTLSGLSVGKHVFTAFAVKGSEVPANTVEVNVSPRPGEWMLFPSPNPGSGANSLGAVSCVSEKRCVAVGQQYGSNEQEALVESWNGRAWSVVPTPALENTASSLTGVSCLSANRCTAVGHYWHIFPGGPALLRTLIETWNGNVWSVAPSPNAPHDDSLAHISCLSASFCVAVGAAYNSGSPHKTLVESWNGTEWSVAQSPSPALFDELRGVSCVSIKFCVAVGNEYSGGAGPSHALVEGWNGKQWSAVPSPSSGPLSGVTCVSAKRCLAVGGSTSGTVVESWNGSTWSVLESPNPEGSGTPDLSGVSCVAAASCAAVGSDTTEGGPSQTLVETSRGGKWGIVSSADSASGVSYLDGVSCVSAESCFAVGEDETRQEGPFQTLVEAGAIQSWDGFGFFRF
jgi:hypothetical protein